MRRLKETYWCRKVAECTSCTIFRRGAEHISLISWSNNCKCCTISFHQLTKKSEVCGQACRVGIFLQFWKLSSALHFFLLFKKENLIPWKSGKIFVLLLNCDRNGTQALSWKHKCQTIFKLHLHDLSIHRGVKTWKQQNKCFTAKPLLSLPDIEIISHNTQPKAHTNVILYWSPGVNSIFQWVLPPWRGWQSAASATERSRCSWDTSARQMLADTEGHEPTSSHRGVISTCCPPENNIQHMKPCS